MPEKAKPAVAGGGSQIQATSRRGRPAGPRLGNGRVPRGLTKSLDKRGDLAGRVRDDIGDLDFWFRLKSLDPEERVQLKLALALFRELRSLPLSSRGKTLEFAIAASRSDSAMFRQLIREDSGGANASER